MGDNIRNISSSTSMMDILECGTSLAEYEHREEEQEEQAEAAAAVGGGRGVAVGDDDHHHHYHGDVSHHQNDTNIDSTAAVVQNGHHAAVYYAPPPVRTTTTAIFQSSGMAAAVLPPKKETLSSSTILASHQHDSDEKKKESKNSTHSLYNSWDGMILLNHDEELTTTFSSSSFSPSLLLEEFRSRIASDIVTGDSSTSTAGQLRVRGGVGGVTGQGYRTQEQQQERRNPYSSMTMFTSPFEVVVSSSSSSLLLGNDSSNNSTNTTTTTTTATSTTTTTTPGIYYKVPMVYCDQTASNRPIRSIEQYIQNYCLPLYGNTHTNTSITGCQSTAFVAEARQIIAEETNAKITGKASLDVVLFAGNGTTSAVELLIDCLGIRHYHNNNISSNTHQRPVVFIGPYEHHSNLIPWRESGCEIVMIPECPITHQVDYKVLEHVLQLPQYNTQNRLKLGTFTAASNITGKVCDVDYITYLLHQYNTLAFFDYATAAPYMKMDMNPISSNHHQYPNPSISIAKDAIFLSPHKVLGGIGTPGILILKKHLISQMNAPQKSGGGTVFYVNHQQHRFLSNRIERYEGGTPNVIGIIRTGLTFLLKRHIEQQYHHQQQQNWVHHEKQQQQQTPITLSSTPSTTTSLDMFPRTIEQLDCMTYHQVVQYLNRNAPNLILMDANDTGNPHLPIFSFLIRFGTRFLHYNYVCAILNDVFGIQSRGGCQCSGPYAQQLLGLTQRMGIEEIPNNTNQQIENALIRYKERAELLRPGFTRISLPFKGLHHYEVDYVLKALVWVAKNGWALMCEYRCNHRTGEWRHRSRQGKPLGRDERRWLSHYRFPADNRTSLASSSSTVESPMNPHIILDNSLRNADTILQHAKSDHRSIMQATKMSNAETVLGGTSGGGMNENDDDQLEKLRWYVYPQECATLLIRQLEPSMEYTVEGALRPLVGDTNTKDNQLTYRKRPIETLYDHSTGLEQFCSTNGTSTAIQLVNNKIDHHQNHDENDRKASGDMETINTQKDDSMTQAKKKLKTDPHKDGVEQVQLKLKPEQANSRKYDIIQDEMEASPELASTRVNTGRPDETKFNPEVATVCKPDEVAVPACCPIPDRSLKKSSRDSTVWGAGSIVSISPKMGPEVSDEIALPSTNKKIKHIKPPPKLMRLINQAITQWDMINNGDRLLLGLSGGKDSLSLLHCLLEYKRKQPIKFDVEVCTIDPMTPSFDPSPLIPYVESLGLKYHYIRDDIVSRASSSGKGGQMVTSLCAFCARMKRGNLYTCARKNNCNKLVLAQHLDDCAETFMMSVMHNGFLRTMKANYQINAGDMAVIRPLVYCRESLMTEFAKTAGLPVINENCPACFEEPKERARVKKLLSREETLYPNFYDNIRRAMMPLLHEDSTAILRCYTEEAVSKSQRNNRGKTQSSQVGNTAIGTASNVNLSDVSDEDLLLALARRKAASHRLAGAMKRIDASDDVVDKPDPTGQFCTLKGGDTIGGGLSIPCYELME